MGCRTFHAATSTPKIPQAHKPKLLAFGLPCDANLGEGGFVESMRFELRLPLAIFTSFTKMQTLWVRHGPSSPHEGKTCVLGEKPGSPRSLAPALIGHECLKKGTPKPLVRFCRKRPRAGAL